VGVYTVDTYVFKVLIFEAKERVDALWLVVSPLQKSGFFV